MAATVLIPTPLRQFTGGAHELAAEGATVAELIDRVGQTFPKFRENLLDAAGRIQPFVHVFVNGRDCRAADGEATAVPDNAEVLILQAISGG